MSDEEVRWHVRIAPGEVKLLTLEQVDDLYRLDMIDGDTLLREDGSKDWIPLRVVAGLDEEDEANDEAPAPPPVSSARPAPPALGSAPPPISNPPPAPLPVSSTPPSPPTPAPPPVRSAPPPPPAPLPPPTEKAQATGHAASAPAPFVHSPSFVPPAPSERRPSAPPRSAPPPSFTPPPPSVRPAPSAPPPPSAPASLAPPAMAALSVPPAPAVLAAQPSRAEMLLIALAVVLGLVVTLNRNGALAAIFAAAGQGAAYVSMEASLGGPGFGTPRAVDALLAKTVAPASSAAAR